MLILLTDQSDLSRKAWEILGGGPAIRQVQVDQSPPMMTEPVEAWIFAADLEKPGTVTAGIRHLRLRELEQPLIVITARRDLKVQARADALGATRVYEIANASALLRDPMLAGRIVRISGSNRNDPTVMAAVSDAVAIVTQTMSGQAINSASDQLNAAVDAAIVALQERGVAAWLKALEDVHQPSYRHVLEVLALSVAFGLQARLPPNLLHKLAVASLLHDIGKTRMPPELLDRGAQALAPNEKVILQKHARMGFDMLRAFGERDADILDAVLHHHEFMDGSGYPHRLKGSQINPLTRMLTIANTYTRFREAPANRPAPTAEQALKRLGALSTKIDVGLAATFSQAVA